MNRSTHTHPAPRARRWLLLILAGLAVYLAGDSLTLLRAAQAGESWGGSGISPGILGLISAGWAYLFAQLAVLIWRITSRARLRAAAFFLFAHLLYTLAQAVLLTQADYNRARLPFLALVILALYALPLVLTARLLRASEKNLEIFTDGSEPNPSKRQQ